MFGVLSKKILPIIIFVIGIVYVFLLSCSDLDYLHSVYGVDVVISEGDTAPNIFTFQALSWFIGILTAGLNNSIQSLIDYRRAAKPERQGGN